MASASPFHSPMTLRCLSATRNERPSVVHFRVNLIRPLHSSPRSVVAFARRRKNLNSASTASKKTKKRSLPHKDNTEDDLGEDPLEALFSLLEEDLKNGDLSLDDDDEEISEEDLAKLERELEEALGDDELLKAFLSPDDGEESGDNNKNGDEEISEEDLAKLELELEQALADDDDINKEVTAANDDSEEEEEGEDDEEEDDDDEQEEEEEEEEEETLDLKNWQLRRLAYALKNGRRKTSIKNLAADVCLDRALVLKLLRDPPPHLLMLSAALPDKPAPIISEPVTRPLEIDSPETTDDAEKPEVAKEVPVHVMQRGWSAQKRLKKVHVETLERVYSRTKRPTNAMINSIIHVTNLPRKKVVKWFEDKRTEDGVPEQRRPYQRSAPETSGRGRDKGRGGGETMATLERSAASFRRQGSSGLIWEDRYYSGDLSLMNQRLEANKQLGEIKRSRSEGSATAKRDYRSERPEYSGKVATPTEPPNRKSSRCCFWPF